MVVLNSMCKEVRTNVASYSHVLLLHWRSKVGEADCSNNEVTNNLKLVTDNLFIYAYKSFLDPWWATLAAIWLNYPTCGHHMHQWILNQLSFLHGSACFKIEVWNSPFAVGCSSMVLRGGGRLQESGIPYRPLYTMTALIKLSWIPSVSESR